MSIKTKNWIRAIVIVGIAAYPAFETYRLWATSQKMAEAQALERSVRVKLEATRARHVQVANTASGAPTPAPAPNPAAPADSEK